MKKNVLALSIAAAIGGLGFAGGASAITTAYNGSAATAGVTATRLTLGGVGASSSTGVGHILLVPYYTAQGSNATLLSITNTHTTLGKAVKVRFRAAANSDDVYDFQVFMSPGDVWTAMVSQDETSGKAKLTTTDNSCTKPATVNGTFVVDRLSRSTWTDAEKAKNTREGYVEILNMGDIPATRAATSIGLTNGTIGLVTVAVANELYTAIKHVGGVAPCTGGAWSALDSDRAYGSGYTGSVSNVIEPTPTADGSIPGYTDSSAKGVMFNPTGGLMGSWTIVNLGDASAYSSVANAVAATNDAGAGARGALVYYPQMPVSIDAFNRSADPLFLNNGYAVLYTASVSAIGTRYNAGVGYFTNTAADAVTAGSVPAQQFDLPDLSTPYVAMGAGTVSVGDNWGYAPARQAYRLSNALAASSVINEYSTVNGAASDWVFSMPTRRYSMAVDYRTPVIAFNPTMNDHFTSANSLLVGDQICVTGIAITSWDRSENRSTASQPPVISPNPPGAPQMFCGETSVLSINDANPAASSVLRGTVAVKGVVANGTEGWMSIATPGLPVPGSADPTARGGLPLLGSSFLKAVSGTSAFGANWDHRFTR